MWRCTQEGFAKGGRGIEDHEFETSLGYTFRRKREKRKKEKRTISCYRVTCLFMSISVLFRTARNRIRVKLYLIKTKNEVIKLAGKLMQLVK